MRQVSKEEFYKAVGPLDVHPRITNSKWPYVSMWEFPRQPHRQPIGKSEGHTDGTHTYYLNEREG